MFPMIWIHTKKKIPHLSKCLAGSHQQTQLVVAGRVQVHLQVSLWVFKSIAVVSWGLARGLQLDGDGAHFAISTTQLDNGNDNYKKINHCIMFSLLMIEPVHVPFIHTHTHIHTHTYIHTHTSSHTHYCTPHTLNPLIHTHTHIHIHTHTHTHIHAYTHGQTEFLEMINSKRVNPNTKTSMTRIPTI